MKMVASIYWRIFEETCVRDKYDPFCVRNLPDEADIITLFRLPVVSDCSAGQTARVTSNLHPTSSMAVSRVPSPPPQEVNTPVAENWCYTQVSSSYDPHIKNNKYSTMHTCRFANPPLPFYRLDLACRFKFLL